METFQTGSFEEIKCYKSDVITKEWLGHVCTASQSTHCSPSGPALAHPLPCSWQALLGSLARSTPGKRFSVSRILRMHHWLRQCGDATPEGHLLDGVSRGCLAGSMDGLDHWGHLTRGQADKVRLSEGPPVQKSFLADGGARICVCLHPRPHSGQMA